MFLLQNKKRIFEVEIVKFIAENKLPLVMSTPLLQLI